MGKVGQNCQIKSFADSRACLMPWDESIEGVTARDSSVSYGGGVSRGAIALFKKHRIKATQHFKIEGNSLFCPFP